MFKWLSEAETPRVPIKCEAPRIETQPGTHPAPLRVTDEARGSSCSYHGLLNEVLQFVDAAGPVTAVLPLDGIF